MAMTVGRLVDGLLARGHSVQLIRRASIRRDDPHRDGTLDVLASGRRRHPRSIEICASVSRWPPAAGALAPGTAGRGAYRDRGAGPFGVGGGPPSAPTGLFRLSHNFHAHSRHYGMGLLARSIVVYLRRFHNRTDCTLVPTEELATELRTLAFIDCGCWRAAWTPDLFRSGPSRSGAASERGAGRDPVALYVAGWRRKKTCNWY